MDVMTEVREPLTQAEPETADSHRQLRIYFRNVGDPITFASQGLGYSLGPCPLLYRVFGLQDRFLVLPPLLSADKKTPGRIPPPKVLQKCRESVS